MTHHTHFDTEANARVWCLDPTCPDYHRREPRWGLLAFLYIGGTILAAILAWWGGLL